MKKIILFPVIFLVLLLLTPQINIQAAKDTVSNVTQEISIEANTNTSTKKITLNYFITEKFNKSSHGIFLALPKNQDGVWTNYSVKKVLRAESETICELNCKDTLDTLAGQEYLDKLPWVNEKFEEINEWNQFRFRVGDSQKLLPPKYYYYEIEIEADYNPDLAYNFNFLDGWNEEILNSNLSLNINGQKKCSNEYLIRSIGANIDVCDKSKLQAELNVGKSKSSLLTSVFYSSWPYFLLFVLVNLLAYFVWKSKAKDDWGNEKLDRPEFEPPALLPWETAYLVGEGQLDLKNTLLSYVLWLSYKKYIKLTPLEKTDKKQKNLVKLEILKDLPTNVMLPDIYNQTVLKMLDEGISEGILSSQINPGTHLDITQTKVKDSVKKYYSQLPFNSPGGWLAIIALVLFFIGAFSFSGIQEVFLIGTSWGWLVSGAFIFGLPGFYFVMAKWAKLNVDGIKITAYSKRYKYYLENVEKLKIDFSNNPQEGVQRYLVSVPFAASFGVLPKFQKYFEDLIPNNIESQSVNGFYTSFAVASFYTPPSDSSSGGGGGGGFSGGGGSW